MCALRKLLFTLVISTLGGCVENYQGTPTYHQYPSYNYSDEVNYYPNHSSYSGGVDYGSPYMGEPKAVKVPESYHLGTYRSPVSAKTNDKSWVHAQNPQAYTVEVADDEKAASVASKLHQAPKRDRMAEIQYQRDGKSYYKGLYGTYNSPEEAQKALDALPDELKNGSQVQQWGKVQSTLNEGSH